MHTLFLWSIFWIATERGFQCPIPDQVFQEEEQMNLWTWGSPTHLQWANHASATDALCSHSLSWATHACRQDLVWLAATMLLNAGSSQRAPGPSSSPTHPKSHRYQGPGSICSMTVHKPGVFFRSTPIFKKKKQKSLIKCNVYQPVLRRGGKKSFIEKAGGRDGALQGRPT